MPPRAIRANTMRAILLASATRVSIGGLRDSISPSHVPGRAAAWVCRLMMTLLAPMISSRLNERTEIFRTNGSKGGTAKGKRGIVPVRDLKITLTHGKITIWVKPGV